MLAIVLIPSAALLVIGVGASGYLVYDGYDAQNWATTMQETVPPGTQFAAQAGEERRLSLQRLGGDESVIPELQEARAELDQTIAGLQQLVVGLRELNPEAIAEGDKAFQELLGKLPELRQGVDAGLAPVQDTYAYYSGLVEVIKLGLQGIAATAPDSKTAVEESTATVLFGAADSMSKSHALAIGGVVRGGLDVEEYHEFSRQVGRYHVDMESAVPILIPDLQERYGKLAASPEWQLLSQVESALLLQGPSSSPQDGQRPELPVSLAEWQAAVAVVNTELLDIYSDHHTYAEGFAEDTGEETFRNSLLGGGAVLLITIIATCVAIRLSNRVVKRMKNLRVETLELADQRLPLIVQRLRNGEQIDITRAVPSLDYGEDELGQVAEAFNKAQRTAVAAAAHEAEIQNGVRTVFLNIAHRSQVVVRRQLEVLDKAEREQEDPDQLESLFQLDHLATRARRNAENLLILGGERPGRRWRNPVPLVEIVRSAIGETEHYRRVNTGRLPDMLMSGSVVADLIHLLAELVDNATAFSPPDSRVEVRGNRVGNGVVVEVEDQGVGIPPDERESINAFLQSPPDFGVMALTEEEARLGLFVVSQLSARHGINVTLVDSVYGGVRAIVLVRSSLIAASSEDGLPQNGNGRVAELENFPGPRHELPDQQAMTMPNQLPDQQPAPTRPAFPEDLSWPDEGSIAERTVRWSPEDLATNDPPPAPTQEHPVTRDPVVRDGGAPRRSPRAAAGDGQTRAGNGRPDDTRPPLPRRRRQANLAPQLTSETDAPPAENGSDPVDAELSAEQARHRMSALQRGTREGRAAQ